MTVSIIIPIFNGEKHLRRCLDSVLSQTFSDFELILINDGSTDDTLSICKEYASIDKRIVIVDQRNAGVSSARNAGLARATGEYVLFVDADDFLGQELVQNFMDHTHGLPDIVISNYIEIQKQGSILQANKAPRNFSLQDLKENYNSYLIPNSVYAKLYKRRLIGDIRFDPNISMGEDTLFNLSYYQKCSNFSRIEEADYFYDCTNQNSATHRYSPNYFRCQKTVYFHEKMFTANSLAWTGDKIDLHFLMDCIADLQQICIRNFPAATKNYLFREICHDDLFVSACLQKCSVKKSFKICQWLCRHRLYGVLKLLLSARKFARKRK